jgi:DNA-binding transcriptional MerR regulator
MMMKADIDQDPMDGIEFGTGGEAVLAPSSHEVPVVVDRDLEIELQRIPDKMAFRIGEVADLLHVKSYVLRYWESEFEQLKPKKSKHNQRMYERRDVEMLMLIKKLLYRDKFSIEGAKSALKKLRKDSQRVKEIRSLADRIEDMRTKAEDLLDDIRRLRNQIKMT